MASLSNSVDNFPETPSEVELVTKVDELTDEVNAITKSKTVALTGGIVGSTTTDMKGNITIDTTVNTVSASAVTGVLSMDNIPKGAMPAYVIVASDTERFALTTEDVQNNDVVVVDSGDGSIATMYWVKDDTKLSSADGYQEFSGGIASGVEWTNVFNKPSTYPPSSHTHSSLTPVIISAATDIDTVGTIGEYIITSATVAAGSTNWPTSNPGHMTVHKVDNQILQTVTDSVTGVIYTRVVGSEWVQTNNYARKSLEKPYRQAQTAYEIGAVVYSSNLPAGKILECVVAGITGTGEDVEITNTDLEALVTDGTVTWEVVPVVDVSDISEGYILGDVKSYYGATIPTGWLELNGNIVPRDSYIELYNWLTQNNLLISESTWQSIAAATPNGDVGFFSSGDGSTTFRLMKLTKGPINMAETSLWENGHSEGSLSDRLLIKAKDAVVDRSEITDAELQVALDKINALIGFCVDDNNNYTIDITGASGNYEADNSQKIQELRVLQALATPNYYVRPSVPSVGKSIITIPAGTTLNIGSRGFTFTADTQVDVGLAGTADARKGKDVYIYACWPEDVDVTTPVLTASLNSTVPSGYTANNSRKIAGVHCLCADVGTISDHTLSGYVAGDILPASIWDLRHRPVSAPEGMVYDAGLGIWIDIYLNSWDGEKLVSAYGKTIADWDSSTRFYMEKFAEYIGKIGKRLPWRNEFQVFAKGSPEICAINDAADPGITGGHVSSTGQRIISNLGLEDCVGVLWQTGGDLFEYYPEATWGYNVDVVNDTKVYNHTLSGYSWQGNPVRSRVNFPESYGLAYGLLRRVLLGGYWDSSYSCGSRCVRCDVFASGGASYIAVRGASEPQVPQF